MAGDRSSKGRSVRGVDMLDMTGQCLVLEDKSSKQIDRSVFGLIYLSCKTYKAKGSRDSVMSMQESDRRGSLCRILRKRHNRTGNNSDVIASRMRKVFNLIGRR